MTDRADDPLEKRLDFDLMALDGTTHRTLSSLLDANERYARNHPSLRDGVLDYTTNAYRA